MERGLVSIDRWGEGSKAYFLTHIHADHTRGLSGKWTRGLLFCSPITARLLPTRFLGFDESLLRPIDLGIAAEITLPSPTTGDDVTIRVTPIDAYHCPGAVMYLFEGEFGYILYTGDFRWETGCKRSQMAKKTLYEALRGNRVDVLYVDNTYCHPSFSFPCRKVAAQQVVDIIKLHPDHDIVIGIDTLGKEDLLVCIAEALSTKIWVWPERLQTMHLLGFDDVFTTKTCLTRVRAVPRYSLTFDTLEALNTIHPTIGVMPSGLPWGVKPFQENDISHGSSYSMSSNDGGRANSIKNISKTGTAAAKKFHHFAYSITYSEHSCFSELEEFITSVQPSKVVGIVSSSFCYIDPRHHFGHLCRVSLPSAEQSDNDNGGEATKRGKIMQSEFVLSCKRSSTKLRSRKEGIFKVSSSGGFRSRVTAVRREKNGAKLFETSSTCSSGS